MENFFIVGSSKCGTTSLHSYLGMHPGIAVSDPKETEFFCMPGNGTYENFFHINDNVRIKGEASPQYFASETIARRIKEYDPEAGIIILVRDPVERARSHYTHNVQRHSERRPFEDVIRADHARFKNDDGDWDKGDAKYLDNIIAMGMYSKFIPIWSKTFKNVLVITYEEFFPDVCKNIQQVFGFLGVDSMDIGRQAVHNKTKSIRSSALHRIILPMYSAQVRRILPSPLKSAIRKVVWSDASPASMSLEERRLLDGIYEDEMQGFKSGYTR